jgi:glutathione peroxidase
VASKCGNTPQYKGLQAIYDKYKKDGFVIIGVPCNQFKKQEPGTDKEIAEFCETNYKITFPMLSKVDVNGGTTCELYKALKEQKKGEIEWNFAKFLVGKNGEVVDRFKHNVKPEDPKIIQRIEEELKK